MNDFVMEREVRDELHKARIDQATRAGRIGSSDAVDRRGIC